jgi:hypothetical protein
METTMDTNAETTNVQKSTFAPFINPVSVVGSIMPERFNGISSPVPVSLVSPDLNSVSGPQTSSQGTGIGSK